MMVGVVSAAIQGNTDPLVATAIAVVVALLLSASGIGSVLGWALQMTVSQFAALGELMISSNRLWLALTFLVLIASAFVRSGLHSPAPTAERDHRARGLADRTDPHGRGRRSRVFFVLGRILLGGELLAAWTRNGSSDGTLLGMIIPVPQSLIHMTLFWPR